VSIDLPLFWNAAQAPCFGADRPLFSVREDARKWPSDSSLGIRRANPPSPVGTEELLALPSSGTPNVDSPQPSDESLGYFQYVPHGTPNRYVDAGREDSRTGSYGSADSHVREYSS